MSVSVAPFTLLRSYYMYVVVVICQVHHLFYLRSADIVSCIFLTAEWNR